jgi:hypothetical protein
MANAGLTITALAGVFARHMSSIAQVAETTAQFPAALGPQEPNLKVGMNTA